MIRPAGHPAYGGAIPGAAAWDADGQYLITDPGQSTEAAAVLEKIRGLAATINFTVPRIPEVTIKVTIPAHLLAGSDLAGTNSSTGAGSGAAGTNRNGDGAAATNRDNGTNETDAAGDAGGTGGTGQTQSRPGGNTNDAGTNDSEATDTLSAETRPEDPHRRAVAAIEGLGPIDADLARYLAQDARWQRVITDPYTGAVLDVGTKTYRPPAQMRRRVIARDQTCRFPGCTRPAERCDVDHIDPHRPDGTGGTTGDCNLIALCRRHHRLKHQTNWRVKLHDDASCEWTSPAGRRYLTYPADTDPPQRD
ncbi:HNH endonuclease [Antricoccus suffuscus]|uniref:HNH endonuclease n=1 Tax=Antricoccus suffuscus TaxID=1629062 RepID=A0A2T1A590_9ACTN|nr:HNH endonuclease signature motif containing protein [Antricoccus suffuscus]PRZ43759.1 HNH endonuclease [Antricoccus suffuscus]